MTLEIDRERWRAARWEAARRGISIRRLLWEYISPKLDKLPPAPGGEADDMPDESDD